MQNRRTKILITIGQTLISKYLPISEAHTPLTKESSQQILREEYKLIKVQHENLLIYENSKDQDTKMQLTGCVKKLKFF